MRSELFWVYLHQSVHHASFLSRFNADLDPNTSSLVSKIQAKEGRRASTPVSKGKIKPMLQGNNALLKLDPIIVGGFLRVEGRLEQSSLSYDQKPYYFS